jgi:hypothetical protein
MELSSTPKEKAAEKTPELAAALLSPKMLRLSERNLFQSEVAASVSAPKKSSPSASNSLASTVLGKLSTSATPGRVPAQRLAGAAKAKTPGKTVDPLSGLTLNATCIVGNQRLAVINGRVYAPREKLPVGKSPNSPYQLVSVDPHKVMLECEGKTVELKYSDLPSRSAPASGAKSGSTAKSSTAKKSSGSSKHAKSGGSSKTGK